MEKHFDYLLNKIKTKEELIFLLEEITNIKHFIFKKEKEEVLSKRVEGKVSLELKNFLEKLEREGTISENPEQQSAFLEKLERHLLSLPKIKLEIAFYPEDNFLTKIDQWLKKILGQKTILDIITNPKIVGGAIIEYRGNWRDFSLATEIDKLISKKINTHAGI